MRWTEKNLDSMFCISCHQILTYRGNDCWPNSMPNSSNDLQISIATRRGANLHTRQFCQQRVCRQNCLGLDSFKKMRIENRRGFLEVETYRGRQEYINLCSRSSEFYAESWSYVVIGQTVEYANEHTLSIVAQWYKQCLNWHGRLGK